MSRPTRRRRPPIVPTARGVGLLVLTPVLWLGGRLLGSDELVTISAATAVVWLTSGLLLLTCRRADVERVAATTSTPVGDRVHATYTVRARMPWLWPIRRLSETLSRHGGATERLSITGATANRRTTIDLGLLPRGAYTLGPSEVHRSDPIGLFDRVARARRFSTLQIWPRTVDVSEALTASGLYGSHNALLRFEEGDEFRQLREFVNGDDIRRVHWGSTARRGRMLVRETDPDDDEAVAIVLDCRAASYPTPPLPVGRTDVMRRHLLPGFELAVSAAASATSTLARLGVPVELLVLPGDDTRVERHRLSSPPEVGRVLDVLAGAAVTGDERADTVFLSGVRAIAASGNRGAVLCTGSPEPETTAALRRPWNRLSPRVVLASEEVSGGAARVLGHKGTLVHIHTLEQVPAAWRAAARGAHRPTAEGLRR